MHLKEGTLLKSGEYRIIRFIAKGGFGYTYEAQHTMLCKRVAIKEFFPKTFCNRNADGVHISVGAQSQKPLVDKLKKKFNEEARSIANLSHKGIVKVTDLFEDNGTAYYVMDYIEGVTLKDIIEEKGKLQEKEALGYINQVCDALSYVHSNNMLHLDIKPGNIMIDDKGRAVLIDFGASRQYDEENGENTSGLIEKTLEYSPVEQLGNKVNNFRPATDIYALGATLYKCLSGKTPLGAYELAEGEELDPLPSEISETTKKAVEAAMEISSRKRPQSIEEFVSILGTLPSPSQVKEEPLKEQPVKEDTVLDAPKPPKKPCITNSDGAYAPSRSSDLSSTANKISSTPSTSSHQNRPSRTHIPVNRPLTPLWDSNTSPKTKPEGPKFYKNKVFIGVAGLLIVAILCWMLFPIKKGPNPTLRAISPSKVKIGEEFSVIYQLKDGQGVNFHADNLDGCLKLSGPIVTEIADGLDYI